MSLHEYVKNLRAKDLEIDARDHAIKKLAEYLDLEYDVEQQFFALVADYKDSHRANQFAEVLTK